jgi:hypothetical protein
MYMFISITPYKIYAFSVLGLNLCIFFLMIGSISSRWLYDFLTVFFKEGSFSKFSLYILGIALCVFRGFSKSSIINEIHLQP